MSEIKITEKEVLDWIIKDIHETSSVDSLRALIEALEEDPETVKECVKMELKDLIVEAGNFLGKTVIIPSPDGDTEIIVAHLVKKLLNNGNKEREE